LGVAKGSGDCKLQITRFKRNNRKRRRRTIGEQKQKRGTERKDNGKVLGRIPRARKKAVETTAKGTKKLLIARAKGTRAKSKPWIEKSTESTSGASGTIRYQTTQNRAQSRDRERQEATNRTDLDPSRGGYRSRGFEEPCTRRTNKFMPREML